MSTSGDHEHHEHHDHSHNHSQGHSHNHGAGASRGRLLVALCLSATVLVAEIVTALLTGSLALLADAGHMVTDVAGLATALTAAHLSTHPATDRSTWGMRRAEVIGAALQAGALAVVGVFVAFKAVHNLLAPPPVEASACSSWASSAWPPTFSHCWSSPGAGDMTDTARTST